MPARRTWILPLAALLSLAAGCEGQTSGRKAAATRPKPADAPAEPPAREGIIGKSTQKVLSVAAETRNGARVLDAPHRNPYVSAVAQAAILNATHNIEIYRAANNGEYPRTAEEFVDGVLKPDGIALPLLPYYLDYGYDEKEHKLVVLEYPERKKERQRQEAAAGR